MRSLRRTALLWMACVITGVGLLGAALAYWVALHEANGFMDVQLRQIARIAGTAPGRRNLPDVRDDLEDDFIVQVWKPDGSLTNAGGHVVDLPRRSVSGFATVNVGGTSWRVFTAFDNGSTVQVAQQNEVRRELAETAALQVAVPLLALVPIGCFVVGWAMNQALGDLRRLANYVENLPAGSRDPIDLARVPTEAAPLVVAMNRLIERLRESLNQQRKFLSDAAHELRTPLTALDLQITNLQHADSAASSKLLNDLRQGARRATTVVEQLLRLARYDVDTTVLERSTLDLRAVLLQAVADHVSLAESRSIDLGVVSSDLASMTGNARDLRILFGNLIDNAVKYSPEGGTVDVGLRKRGYVIEVTIADTGPGIPACQSSRVFDRFFRGTNTNTEGSGLGLAIAESIARRHGLAIQLANRADGTGLLVTVTNRPGSEAMTFAQESKASAGPSIASQS